MSLVAFTAAHLAQDSGSLGVYFYVVHVGQAGSAPPDLPLAPGGATSPRRFVWRRQFVPT